MRLRKIKDASLKLQVDNNPYYIIDGTTYKGKWGQVFNNDNPICIEIGCGKGQFMINLSKQNPNINYIAIEKYDSVLLRILEKALVEKPSNLKLLVMDASDITNYFSDGEISKIYLNFSDPWPKTHHHKRRLTSSSFLHDYKKILIPHGEIIQKTDNRGLFEYSLESFNNEDFLLSEISLDLHKDIEKYPNNITTEFEDKYSSFGPIYRLVARKRD